MESKYYIFHTILKFVYCLSHEIYRNDSPQINKYFTVIYFKSIYAIRDSIIGVIVSVLAFIAVDHGIKH